MWYPKCKWPTNRIPVFTQGEPPTGTQNFHPSQPEKSTHCPPNHPRKIPLCKPWYEIQGHIFQFHLGINQVELLVFFCWAVWNPKHISWLKKTFESWIILVNLVNTRLKLPPLSILMQNDIERFTLALQASVGDYRHVKWENKRMTIHVL